MSPRGSLKPPHLLRLQVDYFFFAVFLAGAFLAAFFFSAIILSPPLNTLLPFFAGRQPALVLFPRNDKDQRKAGEAKQSRLYPSG